MKYCKLHVYQSCTLSCSTKRVQKKVSSSLLLPSAWRIAPLQSTQPLYGTVRFPLLQNTRPPVAIITRPVSWLYERRALPTAVTSTRQQQQQLPTRQRRSTDTVTRVRVAARARERGIVKGTPAPLLALVIVTNRLKACTGSICTWRRYRRLSYRRDRRRQWTVRRTFSVRVT